MSPENLKDIENFKKIVSYNLNARRHTQSLVAAEAKISVPTLMLILKTEYSRESSFRASILASIQDYNKRHTDIKQYLNESNDKEIEKVLKPKKERKPYTRASKKKEKPLAKKPDFSNFIIEENHPSPESNGSTIYTEDLIMKIRKDFPDSEINIVINIKIPR